MSLRYSMVIHTLILSVLLGFPVFAYGGVLDSQWDLFLLIFGASSAVYWLLLSRCDLAPAIDPVVKWLLLLLPAYVALQLVPLPASVMRILSPAREDLVTALAPVAGESGMTPLTAVPQETVRHLFRLLTYIAAFLLSRQIAWRFSHWPWLPVLPLIIVAALQAAIGIAQHALDPSHPPAHGAYVNRNHFAGMLEMALPFAAMYPVWILQRSRNSTGPSLSPGSAPGACVLLTLAAVILTGILYSFSRMGFLVSILSVAIMTTLTLQSRRRLVLPLSALALVAFLFLAPSSLISRFSEFALADNWTTDTRFIIWNDTWRMIRDHPFAGVGLGSYAAVFPRYQTAVPEAAVLFAHNDALQAIAELGILGSSLVFALIARLGALLFLALPHLNAPGHRPLAVACCAALAAFLLHSFVDFNFYIPANVTWFVWIAGLASAVTLFSSTVRPTLPGATQVLEAKAWTVWR